MTKLITTHPDYWLLIGGTAKQGSLYWNGELIKERTDVPIPGVWQNNVITAHLPKAGASVLEGVPLLPAIPQQEEDIEDLADAYSRYNYEEVTRPAFLAGYKAATKDRKYSEEEVIQSGHDFFTRCMQAKESGKPFKSAEWWKEYLASLSPVPVPVDFEPMYIPVGRVNDAGDDWVHTGGRQLKKKLVDGVEVVQGKWIFG